MSRLSSFSKDGADMDSAQTFLNTIKACCNVSANDLTQDSSGVNHLGSYTFALNCESPNGPERMIGFSTAQQDSPGVSHLGSQQQDRSSFPLDWGKTPFNRQLKGPRRRGILFVHVSK